MEVSVNDTLVIISIVNQKGGVGKTTTAVNLGAALSRAGFPTLLVDIDPQGNATSGLAVPEDQRVPGTYEVLRGEHPAAAALRLTVHEGYQILPSTPDLVGASVELLATDNREFHLREALQPLAGQFAYMIIDTPPSLGILTMNAFVAADAVLIPVQTEYYSLEGLGQLLQTIALVRNHLHPHLEILGAVLTMFDRRITVAHDVVREVREHFPGHVFPTVVPRSVRLAEAPSYGQTIFAYDENSPGALAYARLGEEVHTRVQELFARAAEANVEEHRVPAARESGGMP